MRHNSQFLFLLILLVSGDLFSATAGKSKAARYGKTNIADMVLIYHGGVHRPIE